MKQKLDEKALAWSLAIVAAISMALLWIGGKVGIYEGAAKQMQNMHMFFSLSIGGLIGGVIEAAVLSFVAGWLIAWFYNKYA